MSDDAWQYHFDPTTYLEMVTTDIPDYVELQERTAEATRGPEVRRILELGIGTGETAIRVLARHERASLVGIDESPAMLAVAREQIPDADLRVARIEEPLGDEEFDLVVAALAVHHLDGEAKADLFRRIFERLRPGGRFVMTDVVVPADPSEVTIPVDGVHDQPSSLADQLAWLGAAGFQTDVVWTRHDLAIVVADRPAPSPR